MKFIPPVQRINRGRYHIYQDGEGKHIPGVTTILGDGIPKPQLIDWAGNATADRTVDRWDELAAMPVAARLDTIKRIRYDVTNAAKNKGTQVHSYAERLVQGEEITGIPALLRPYVENYARFIDTWELDPILVEVVVVNYDYGYAGTLDLVAELTIPDGTFEWQPGRCKALLDIKTGEKGVFSETALQLAAYRYAQFYVDQDGNEQKMVPVDHCAAIHITADDAVLVPTVSEDAQLKTFRIAQKVYEYSKDKDGLILPALQHPGTSTARIVWGDDE